MRKLLIAALITAAGMSAASAQSFPTRPITAIVPASAGGPTDTIGRIVMARAQQLLGQTIIIENVGGASGTLSSGTGSGGKSSGTRMAGVVCAEGVNPLPASEPQPESITKTKTARFIAAKRPGCRRCCR